MQLHTRVHWEILNRNSVTKLLVLLLVLLLLLLRPLKLLPLMLLCRCELGPLSFESGGYITLAGCCFHTFMVDLLKVAASYQLGLIYKIEQNCANEGEATQKPTVDSQ